MIRARIYSERPDWWLLIADEQTVLHHARFFTWRAAVERLQRLRGEVHHSPVCDGKCAR